MRVCAAEAVDRNKKELTIQYVFNLCVVLVCLGPSLSFSPLRLSLSLAHSLIHSFTHTLSLSLSLPRSPQTEPQPEPAWFQIPIV